VMNHEDLKDLEDKIERGCSLRSWRSLRFSFSKRISNLRTTHAATRSAGGDSPRSRIAATRSLGGETQRPLRPRRFVLCLPRTLAVRKFANLDDFAENHSRFYCELGYILETFNVYCPSGSI